MCALCSVIPQCRELVAATIPFPPSPPPRRPRPSHAVGTSPVYLSVGFFFLFARKNHEGFRARFASSKVSVRCGASIRKLFKITYILRGELRMRAFERVFLFPILFRSLHLSPSPAPSVSLFFLTRANGKFFVSLMHELRNCIAPRLPCTP